MMDGKSLILIKTDLVIGFILSLGFIIISLMVIFNRYGHIEKYLRIHNQYLKIQVLSAYFPVLTNGENSV